MASREGVVALSDLIDLGAEPRVNLRSARFVDAGEVQQNDLIGKISRSIDDEDAKGVVQAPPTLPDAHHAMKEIVNRSLEGDPPANPADGADRL
jgi:hypothetical protein